MRKLRILRWGKDIELSEWTLNISSKTYRIKEEKFYYTEEKAMWF